jgi:hypothetical protein
MRMLVVSSSLPTDVFVPCGTIQAHRPLRLIWLKIQPQNGGNMSEQSLGQKAIKDLNNPTAMPGEGAHRASDSGADLSSNEDQSTLTGESTTITADDLPTAKDEENNDT